MGGEGSGRKPDLTKQFLKKEAPIAMQSRDEGFAIPNYSGMKGSTRARTDINAIVGIEFLGEVGGYNSLGGSMSTNTISVPSGKCQRNDTLIFIVTGDNTGGSTPVVIVGGTEMKVANDMDITTQGGYFAFAKQLPKGADFTTQDVGILSMFGSTASAGASGRNIQTDFNVDDWITGAFTLRLDCTAGATPIKCHMSVFLLRGGSTITIPDLSP